MNIFQTVTSSSKAISSVYRIARATLRTIAPIKPILRQFSYKALLHGVSVFAVILIFSGYRVSGIEGLTISVQNGTNIVLGWPSATNETYFIQTIPAFGSTNSWLVLTDYYPAFANTNWTTYTITNAIPAPSGGGSGSGSGTGSPPSPDAVDYDVSTTANDTAVELAPGDSMVPPSPWIPASLPNGAILEASGIYVPLPAQHASQQASGNFASPDDSTNSAAPDPGFYEVVRDGAHIFGLANGAVLSGEVQFPIEYAVANADQITGVAFYDTNDSPIIGAAGLGTNNQWTLDWSTPMSPNGTYTIYAEIDFASNEPAMSLPVTVTISNVISFPNYLTQLYGNQMWIFAQTIPNAAYEIDMYDESNNYLGSFEDYSDPDGYISFLWNLVDGTGNTNSSTNFSGVFTVDTSSLSEDSVIRGNASSATSTNSTLAHKTLVKVRSNGVHPDGGTSTASANQYWTHEPKWTAKDTWVVAYGLFSASAPQQNADTYMIAGGVQEDEPYQGVLGTLDAYGFNNNLSPGNNPQGGQVFTMADQASRSNLLTYLASGNYDNFYFFGHGSASSIGAYNGTCLTQGDISSALLNVPLSWPIMHAARTPYRFVFIDGCNTGKGNFCEAFAIPAAALSTDYFAAAGLESRAFVGFKSWSIDLNIYTWQGYSEMTSHFLQDWEREVPVQQCVNNAKSDVYNTGNPMDSSAVVYGAIDLQNGTHTGQ
jgi:hypothetical protein